MSRSIKAALLAGAVAVASLLGTGSAGGAADSDALGVDVSNFQGTVDWNKVKKDGRDFAYVLATDGTSFTNSSFGKQHSAAMKAGLLRGAYHFGRPSSSASEQAAHFLDVANYAADGSRLPPVLDLEADPEDGGCYGLSAAKMKSWIATFLSKVRSATGQDAIIYTSPGFWRDCTGNSKKFSANPLWIADWGVDRPHRIGGWDTHTFWQYSNSGSVDGIGGKVDVNRFNGSLAELKKLAR